MSSAIAHEVHQLRQDVQALTQRLDEADQAAYVQGKALLAARRHIFNLTTKVAVLTEVLAEVSNLDLVALHERLYAALAAPPFTSDHPEPTSPDKATNCAKCWEAFKTESMNMTAKGLFCVPCSRGL